MRLPSIDGLRAIAVLGVIQFHALHHTSSGLLLGFAAAGARGVELFFVLSGFCLSYPSLRRLHAGEPFSFDLVAFFRARFWRIAPPYWAALALFLVLALTPFGTPHAWAPLNWRDIAQDFFLLHYTHASKLNSAFWTLVIEARWYFIFPAALLLYVRSKPGFAALIVACYAMWMFVPGTPGDIACLPAFLLGIVAADLSFREPMRLVPLAAVCSFVVGLRIEMLTGDLSPGYPLWDLAFFLIVLAGVTWGPFVRVLSVQPLVFIGVASYSLYLVHQPLIDTLNHHVAPWIGIAVVLAAGFAFWRYIEAPLVALGAKGRGTSQSYRRSPEPQAALLEETRVRRGERFGRGG